MTNSGKPLTHDYVGMMYGVVEMNDNGNWTYHYTDVGRYGITQAFYTTPSLEKAKKFAAELTELNGKEHKIVSRQVTPWVFMEV